VTHRSKRRGERGDRDDRGDRGDRGAPDTATETTAPETTTPEGVEELEGLVEAGEFNEEMALDTAGAGDDAGDDE